MTKICFWILPPISTSLACEGQWCLWISICAAFNFETRCPLSHNLYACHQHLTWLNQFNFLPHLNLLLLWFTFLYVRWGTWVWIFSKTQGTESCDYRLITSPALRVFFQESIRIKVRKLVAVIWKKTP